MGRYLGPSCRLCRREGAQLFLKGNRCISEKCAVRRRKSGPGEQQGKKRRSKPSDYAIHLREKQKVKRMYCLLEKQFSLFFYKAQRLKGKTGEQLLILLERRLDNVVYKLNFAISRNQARQLVNHGHVTVNGKKVTIPSFLIKKDDVIEIKEKSKNITIIRSSLKNISRVGVPSWLEVDENLLKGKVLMLPQRENIVIPADENLIVEFYSK